MLSERTVCLHRSIASASSKVIHMQPENERVKKKVEINY